MQTTTLSRNGRFQNLLNQRFGLLTVVSYLGKRDRDNLTIWNCLCDCGTEKVVPTKMLLRGQARSCGCLRKQNRGVPRHGHTAGGMSPEYSIYSGAKARCSNPNRPHYGRYGGRGIEFRFACFEDFLAELGPRPSPEYSLERVDNDGHYEPGNVRWATRKEQAANRRKPVK